MTKKRIFGSIGFLAILGALLVLTSFIFKTNSDVYNIVAVERKTNDIKQEKENTIDLAILGDSESYSAFIPHKMWKDAGITSYICGTSLQRLCDTFELIKEVYKKQSPQIVMIETNCLFRYAGSLEEENGVVDRAYSKVFPILKYHTRWKAYVDLENGSQSSKHSEKKLKGFKYRTGIEPYVKGPWMMPTKDKAELGGKVEEYIKKIKDYVEKQGGKLILVSVPSPTNWDMKKHNATVEVADKYDLDFYDLNTLAEEIGIDWAKDTKDAGNHLNFDGAIKTTDFFSKILVDKYKLSNHKDDPYYSDWEEGLINSQMEFHKK